MKKRKGVEAEAQQEESWAFSAFAESLVSLLERLVPCGLVAGPCAALSSAGHLESSREQIHITSGL